MAERRQPTDSAEKRPSKVPARAQDDEVERTLGRVVALGLPLASVGGAVVVGALAGVSSALLVLAAGALLGAIGFFWASVRTLSGDAPLPLAFEALPTDRRGVDTLVEEKLRSLRALKDLENEHELGKIDDADYQNLLARYRDEAKSVMRRMDDEVAPFRPEAERIAHEYLRSLAASSEKRITSDPAQARSERITCSSCKASNEPDAAFCKQCASALKKERPGAYA